MSYDEWIEAYVAAQPDRFVRGECKDATSKMIEAFPELRIACGFVHTTWGSDQHFWCVAPDGTIVDPTREQFPIVFQYEEIDPEKDRDRVPTGVCMDCGEPVYLGKTFCSDECEQATVAYLNDANRYAG